MAKDTFDCDFDEAFKACKAALKQLNWEVIDSSKSNGQIQAKKGGGFLTYGHSLVIEIDEGEEETVKIRVKSETDGPQVIDWGTNKANEREILDALEDLLA